jgi:hypothetical protein
METSDEEIICAWMEPDYQATPFGLHERCEKSKGGWWERGRNGMWYTVLGRCEDLELLGYLWEVEERLTAEQWAQYGAAMLGYSEGAIIRYPTAVENKLLLHATPEQKITALAAVLRQSERKRVTR